MNSVIDISRAKNIYGQMDEEELLWLSETASRCKIIAELGCFHGRSTRALADHSPGVVYAVDDWHWQENNPHNSFSEFRFNLEDHIDKSKVIIVPIRHEDAEIFYNEKSFDMIFLDGDHEYQAVRRDIRLALPHMNKGGILCGHDYSEKRFPGVVRAVNELLPQAKKVTNTELAIWAAIL